MTQPLPGNPHAVRRSAVLSACGRYRYLLVREWAAGKNAVFILLNPSTADATKDDNTSGRCISYARAWGCGSLLIVNLYAWRATNPRDLAAADDPVGPDNDAYLRAAAAVAEHTNGPLVAGWGTHALPGRVDEALAVPGMHRLNALALTQAGHPHHPLRLHAGLTPQPWQARPTRRQEAEDARYAVVLARPGLPDLRYGPHEYLHRAASIATSLRQQLSSTQHVPGTTVTVHPYLPDLDYTEPFVPRDPDQLADLMDTEPGGDGTGRNFPDLWARLEAQEGYEEAERIWRKACIAYDVLHHAPAE
ncbi:DUF1643 domain-containing protein [Streptomyces fuscichromogenes]|uniref:DUF1643 domain-containing protein n=1 Tax=Streptomyces fuscichromogenes TaxID=1324013 RepID=A0A917XPS0_9ACTN|nr:DUF1643 domain-containing protein [Streptomyces fuscichromogenes]GGN46338.1 hypothetical protein GCM10011578_099160 [Streptomyces fuscichromogenes]